MNEALNNTQPESNTNKQKQVSDSFLYMLSLVTNNLFLFITIPVFTRIITKEDYGALALAQIYGMLVGGIANFGMLVSYDGNWTCALRIKYGLRLRFKWIIIPLLSINSLERTIEMFD